MGFKDSLERLLKAGNFLFCCVATEYHSNFNGKQKMVIEVCMPDAKRRAKAFQVVARLLDVLSVQIDGKNIVVVGDGIDSVELTLMLRKEMGFAKLESVSAVVEEKEEKKDKPPEGANKDDQQKNWPYPYPMTPHVYVLD